MAITKAKRSVHKKQRPQVRSASRSTIINVPNYPITKSGRAVSRSQHNPRDRFARFPHTRFFSFRQAQGKTIGRVEFSASPDHHDITLWFTDKTCLNFSIEAGFTLKTIYADWTSGEQRVLRTWPRLTMPYAH